MKNNKYLIFALGFAVVNAAAVFFIFGFRMYGDTVSYIDAIHWFQGKSVDVIDPWVVLKPLGILLALPFEFLGAGAGLIVQDIVFYLLSTVLIFKVADLIFNNPFDKLRASKQALLASLFFVTITQVLEVGLSYLTDMGAWFFYLLSIFLTLLYFRGHDISVHSVLPTRLFALRFAQDSGSPHPNPSVHRYIVPSSDKLIILSGFISGLGVLMKENGGLGVLFFGLMVLLSGQFSIKEKISKILRFAAFFLIPIMLWQAFMYWKFGLTSLDWYLFQLNGFSHGESNFAVIIKYFGQLFRTLGILWIFFLVGLWQELKEKNWQRLRIYLALLPGSLSFFLWPISAGGRSAFVFVPLGILLAICGIKKIKPLFLALIFGAILIINYWFVSVNQQIPFTELIYTLLFSR